jgi:hypothetical protein
MFVFGVREEFHEILMKVLDPSEGRVLMGIHDLALGGSDVVGMSPGSASSLKSCKRG